MRSAVFSSSLLLLSAVLLPTAVGTPIDPYYDEVERKCENPIQRKEWRTLSDGEKNRYIDAVKCLIQKPPTTTQSAPGALSRFDDFLGVHLSLAWTIHYVGRFLPWHRYFLALYEKALKEECGYEDGHPYWDWTLDAEDFPNSPLFDPVTGFGGNGVEGICDTRCLPGGTGGGCIQDGPFKDHVLHMGPRNFTGVERNDHCLKRNFNPRVSKEFLAPAVVESTLAHTKFEDFIVPFEGIAFNNTHLGQHAGGHLAVGGTLADFFASPGDPIFYMHHAAIDWLWSVWQSQDPARLEYISGKMRINETNSGETTLKTRLDFGQLADEIAIVDVMDIRGGLLCYEYV